MVSSTATQKLLESRGQRYLLWSPWNAGRWLVITFLSCAEQAQTGQHTRITLGTLGDAKETVTQEVSYILSLKSRPKQKIQNYL